MLKKKSFILMVFFVMVILNALIISASANSNMNVKLKVLCEHNIDEYGVCDICNEQQYDSSENKGFLGDSKLDANTEAKTINKTRNNDSKENDADTSDGVWLVLLLVGFVCIIVMLVVVISLNGKKSDRKYSLMEIASKKRE